jgi:hypothetical protein
MAFLSFLRSICGGTSVVKMCHDKVTLHNRSRRVVKWTAVFEYFSQERKEQISGEQVTFTESHSQIYDMNDREWVGRKGKGNLKLNDCCFSRSPSLCLIESFCSVHFSVLSLAELRRINPISIPYLDLEDC